MTAAPRAYRTLFVGVLRQDASASFGGREDGGPEDDPFARDGAGRLTLRGTSLAGALVATARRLYRDIPPFIAHDPAPTRGSEPRLDSAWRFFHTHPEDDVRLESRQGVGILQATGAAAEGILFDAETTAPGTRWWFCLEVDLRLGGAQAEAIAAHALLEWAAGRCWLGRAVARGMGWMTLEGLYSLRLDTRHVLLWPDASHCDGPRAVVETLAGRDGVTRVEAADFATTFVARAPDARWQRRCWDASVTLGPRDDGYGLDGLSIGGHARQTLGASWDDEHFVGPAGLDAAARAKRYDPTTSIVMTSRNGALVPVIPGSSLRGPMRHALSRHLRRGGATVRDPNRGGSTGDDTVVEAIFGSVAQSGSLLVRDAVCEGPWRCAWVHHHAEDEFAGGVFQSALFSRVMVLAGRFTARVVLEAPTRAQLDAWSTALTPVIDLSTAGHLPVGGAQWRGAAWARWTWKEVT